MNFKYRFSIPKIKCKEDISTGFLISEDMIITTMHSIIEYINDNKVVIEVIFIDESGNKSVRQGTPVLPKSENIGEFKIIALKLNEPIKHINPLECIKYSFEDIKHVFTYGYPAVSLHNGTVIELKVLGLNEEGYLDLKADSDTIKDYEGCSGGPIIYKNFVTGIMLEQASESGDASRLGAISIINFEEYFKEIGLELFEKASDIYRFDEELMDVTKPKISLNFFDYEDDQFKEDFLAELASVETIYLQGKTKEEVMGYALYIIKTEARSLIPRVRIIDGLEEWNRLKDSCEDKILIPNFNANEITVIPKNVNIILYGEEDFIGNKKVLKLKKRTLNNMRDKLNVEIDNSSLANKLVRESNGLYSTFKRMIFEGKNGNPKWEEYANESLVPALLASSWRNQTKDYLFLEKLSCLEYNQYIDSIKPVTNGEDPFILQYSTNYEDTFKLANVEESWEILFSEVNQYKLELFKELALEVLSEVSAKFDLPLTEQYRFSLLTDEGKEYSCTLRKGIIRSLIALSMTDSNDSLKYQAVVDEILRSLFNQLTDDRQWFAIAEYLPLLAEASPVVFIDFIKEEVDNPSSSIWCLFENTSSGFWGKNYYTNLLWALEKLLCLENTVSKSIKILVKLSERDVKYKISNSPISTLAQALSAWLHEINVSVDEKIELVEGVVEESSIGWDLLEKILPDRRGRGAFLNMNRLNHRPYEFENEFKYQDQIDETDKKYTSIAIVAAGNDLEKWGLLFDKCMFFEYGLNDLVREKLVTTLSENHSDEQKFVLKEKMRHIIYNHRFFKNSHWALNEKHLEFIEELFNLINFECNTYNYLYLFINHGLVSLKPNPYNEDERADYNQERQELREERVKALKIIKAADNSIWNLVKLLNVHDDNKYSQVDIGSILACEIDNYNLNLVNLNEVIENSAQTLLISYINEIYMKKGHVVLESALEFYKSNDELVVFLLKIAKVDEDFLALLEPFPENIKSNYWKSYTLNWDIKDISVRIKVWKNLLENKNFNSLFEIINKYFEKDLEKNLIILEEILLNQEFLKIDSQSSYLIIEVFKNIYNESNLNIERSLYLRICHLEWAYFNLLIEQSSPKYLLNELKTDPTLLATLIKTVHESTKDLSNSDEVDHNLKKQASDILWKLNFCPSVNENNEILEDELEAWVKMFLAEIDKSGHEKVGRRILGNCFAHSPKNIEEIYPIRPVCKVFEKYYTEDIGIGFVTGIYNKRGVFTRTNGREEESLAIMYEGYAKKIRIKFPEVSSQLLKIADNYRSEAFRERESAAHNL